MRNKLKLISLLAMWAILSTYNSAGLCATFDVSVRRSATAAADTLDIIWTGVAAADSLQIRWDLNDAPDRDGCGKQVGRVVYVAADTNAIAMAMPEGCYIWFALLADTSGVWFQVDRDSLYIRDRTYGWPRAGAYFSGISSISGAYIHSLSTFDVAVEPSRTIYPNPAEWDTLAQLNSNIVRLTHEYLWEHNITEGSADSVLEPTFDVLDTLIQHYAANDSIMLWVLHREQLKESINLTTAAGRRITVGDDIASDLAGYDWGGLDSEKRPQVLISDGTNYAFVSVDTSWDNAGTDSISVINNANARNATSFDTSDSLYLLDNNYYHGGSWNNYAGHLYLITSSYDNQGASDTLMTVKGRQDALDWEARKANGNVVVDGLMWDTFYQDYTGVRPYSGRSTNFMIDDASYIAGAVGYRDTVITPQILAINAGLTSWMGVEDSLVNFFLVGEDDVVDDDSRYYSDVDMLYQYILGFDISRYRYGMRSDNWPPYYLMNDYDGNNADYWRFHAALSTIFGAVTANKHAFSTGARWIDELWVAPSGNVAPQDDVDTNRWWLGWPIEPIQYLVIDTLSAGKELITTGTFETGRTGWSASDSDSVSVTLVADITHNASDSALRIISNMGYQQYDRLPDPNGNTETHWFGDGVGGAYVAFNDTINLADSTIYTLHFYARASKSRTMGVRLKGSDKTWTTVCHVPETWKEHYFEIFVDISRAGNDLSDLDLQFGITPIKQPDDIAGADTIWVDDISLKQGTGIVGYYRRFGRGIVLVNISHTDATVNIPGAANVYKEITGNSNYSWSDPTENNGQSIGDTHSISAHSGLFLIRQDIAPPVRIPEARRGFKSATNINNGGFNYGRPRK